MQRNSAVTDEYSLGFIRCALAHAHFLAPSCDWSKPKSIPAVIGRCHLGKNEENSKSGMPAGIVRAVLFEVVVIGKRQIKFTKMER